MANELKMALRCLEKLNEKLRKKVFNSDQIAKEIDYIDDIPEIRKEINVLINKLNSIDLEDIDQVLEALVYLHVKFGNYISRIELVHDMVKQMMTHYEECV